MEMITISSKDGITEERETVPKEGDDNQGLYPEAEIDPSKRPFVFD
ncbi:MAG: hypothetical protein ACK5NI_01715 [bacterium]|jgi:hypothetical protein